MTDDPKPIPEAQIAEAMKLGALATADGIRRDLQRTADQARADGLIVVADTFAKLAAGLTPSIRHPAEDERDALLSLLREVEWSRPAGVDGCLDSCPVCRREKPWRTERGTVLGGHASDCRLAAFLGRGT